MDEGPSAIDLQAQILLELKQANNLAQNTRKNVKKMAKNAKPNNYLSNEELDKLEDEVTHGRNESQATHGRHGSQANINFLGENDHGEMSDAGSNRKPGSSMSVRRHLSPSK